MYSPQLAARGSRTQYVCLSIVTLGLMLCLVDCQMIGMVATAHLVNVTSHDEYWEGFEKDGICEVQRDVFMMRDPPWPKKKYALAVPKGEGRMGMWEYRAPPTVEDFLNDHEDWPHLVGIVETGTRIQVQRMYAINALFIPLGIVTPHGTILDGEYEGRSVELLDLCNIIDVDAQPMLCRPDDRLLKLVE